MSIDTSIYMSTIVAVNVLTKRDKPNGIRNSVVKVSVATETHFILFFGRANSRQSTLSAKQDLLTIYDNL